MLVRNLQGTGIPPEATGPGLAARWPAFTKPGPGFLRNPGLMPVPKAAGTKTRDGIKDRLWAQLLFLEARPRGGYSGSLLCLGHFKVKFSSMNVQPVSLAQG